jgi:hypothetical protein
MLLTGDATFLQHLLIGWSRSSGVMLLAGVGDMSGAGEVSPSSHIPL